AQSLRRLHDLVRRHRHPELLKEGPPMNATAPRTIDPSELFVLCQKDPSTEVIDVRTPPEFREVHATVARTAPLDRLSPRDFLAARGARAAQPIYILCKTGVRANTAAERFAAEGFGDAVVVMGGTQAWVAAGLPVERGKKAISLERQVRIAAGSLVLTFAILAIAINPWFAAGCAFIGAGLTFAGITDWCGMGLLLARAPWNRA
ncbi:MAG: rhodanese-like domain-containing protein, partial [Candidatus Sumerlaeota bacterium]